MGTKRNILTTPLCSAVSSSAVVLVMNKLKAPALMERIHCSRNYFNRRLHIIVYIGWTRHMAGGWKRQGKKVDSRHAIFYCPRFLHERRVPQAVFYYSDSLEYYIKEVCNVVVFDCWVWHEYYGINVVKKRPRPVCLRVVAFRISQKRVPVDWKRLARFLRRVNFVQRGMMWSETTQKVDQKR
jgi:hypothetical protein